MHDSTLERTTNGTGKVSDRTLAYITGRWLEIPGVDVDGNGNDDNTPDHPPSLDQALAKIAPMGKMLAIELKGSGWTSSKVSTYLARLRYYNVQARTISHSTSTTVLDYLKVHAPSYPRGSVISTTSLPSVSTVKSRGGYVFLNHKVATKTYVDELQAADVKVFIYTLDRAEEYENGTLAGCIRLGMR